MTKKEAKKNGYCDHCAAVTNGKQLCGVLKTGDDKKLCQLDIETQQRWRKEHRIGSNQKKTVFSNE